MKKVTPHVPLRQIKFFSFLHMSLHWYVPGTEAHYSTQHSNTALLRFSLFLSLTLSVSVSLALSLSGRECIVYLCVQYYFCLLLFLSLSHSLLTILSLTLLSILSLSVLSQSLFSLWHYVWYVCVCVWEGEWQLYIIISEWQLYIIISFSICIHIWEGDREEGERVRERWSEQRRLVTKRETVRQTDKQSHTHIYIYIYMYVSSRSGATSAAGDMYVWTSAAGYVYVYICRQHGGKEVTKMWVVMTHIQRNETVVGWQQ